MPVTRRTSLAVLLTSLLVPVGAGCGRPPQIGPDPDAFKAVDALYTAVSLRDPGLVAGCRAKLKGLRDEGKMPPTAFASLEGILDEAGQKKWESAVSHLARFMEGQRR